MFKERRNRIYLRILVVLCWLTIPFLGKETIKRYWPGAIFMGIFVYIESIIAEKLKWWKINTRLVHNYNGVLPLIFGPFVIGSLWILKFTYGKFYQYLLVNLAFDSFFSYPFYKFFKSLGIWKAKRLSQAQLLLLFSIKSVLMYGFQKMVFTLRDKSSKEN